jgi:hypothetical protein
MPSSLKINCIVCGKTYIGHNTTFCSLVCKKEHTKRYYNNTPIKKCLLCGKEFKQTFRGYLSNKKQDICYLCERKKGDREYYWKNKEFCLSTCRKLYQINKDGVHERFLRLRQCAKRRNIVFNLKEEYFINWYKEQKEECSYCGITKEVWNKFFSNNGFGYPIKNLSFDRIDNYIGYEENNLTIACQRCNLIKNDILTYDEMKEIGEKYIKPKWMKLLTENQ